MLAKSAKAGDVDATFGVLVDEQGKPLKAWFKAQAELAKAIDGFADTLDASFGKDLNSPVKKVNFDLKAELTNGFGGVALAGKPKMIDPDLADVPVKATFKGPDGKELTRDASFKTRKTDSGWKVAIPEFTNNDLDFAGSTAFMNNLRASMERVTKLVKDGAIKTRADVMKELEKDRPEKIPGNIPMPRFLTRPG